MSAAAATEVYTLSLHDALPISLVVLVAVALSVRVEPPATLGLIIATMVTVRVAPAAKVRKSTRLDVRHAETSHADTYVTQAGSVSLSETACASDGPALVSVRV